MDADQQQTMPPPLSSPRQPLTHSPQTPTMQPLRRLTLLPSVNRQHWKKLSVIKRDIANMRDVDVLVSCTTLDLIRGYGVDDAIHRACLPQMHQLEDNLRQQLWAECRDHPEYIGQKLPPGTVLSTPPYGGLAARETGIKSNLYILYSRIVYKLF